MRELGWPGLGCVGTVVAALGWFAGCASPTLPMPPPGEPFEYEIGVDRQSLALRGSGAIPGARVLAENLTVGDGSGVFVSATPRGEYYLTVRANLIDVPQNEIEIWMETGLEVSLPLVFVAPPTCSRTFTAGGAEVPAGVVHKTSCEDLYSDSTDGTSDNDSRDAGTDGAAADVKGSGDD